jgi:hypothetical protein
VASLWNVNDAATSVLMEEFYQQLWKHNRTPLEALRLAQLAVLKDPQRVYRQAEKLKPLLAKLAVKRKELAARGFEDDAEMGKACERSSSWLLTRRSTSTRGKSAPGHSLLVLAAPPRPSGR